MTEPEILPPLAKPKRPTEFADEIFDIVCERMTEGEGLREICSDPQMPSKTTFLRWVEKDDGRQRRYQLAREALMDHYADQIRAIAWDDSNDTVKREGKPDLCNHEWINRSRLKVDTLKFLMAKLHPKRYGDKTELLTAAAPEQGSTMQIGWKTPVRVIVYPMLRSDGTLIRQDSPDYEEAIEKAAREASARGLKDVEIGTDLEGIIKPPPPSQITYQPEPLPHDLSPEDWSLLTEVINLIRRTIPTDSNAVPETIFSVIRQALLMHFRCVEIEGNAADAA
ncbi:hypothetical protein [Bradyrhizobium lablabi]|uniref:terminase small subunit-like protein n=1 Tax=Bradyrhizobium lablabi TaxID=722472 RepID=UPI00090C9E44|nr:hypothetical protein [Bradyrhizobium lablabi]SHM41178.1 hypothetical protein SAMN05444321_6255 [Bradyrhizobium lablabi]